MPDRDGSPPRTYLTDPAETPDLAGERVPFVSRSTPAERESDPGAPTSRPPRLLAAWTLLLFLLAFTLQLYSWHRLEGYQLADSVEYMERAHIVASGVQLSAEGAVRSFGFSTLLVPFFAVARWLGVEELLPVIHTVRLFQMLVGLGLLFLCMRLGARLGGRRAGYVAGIICAINPIFLQYSVSPVSGVAAAFFVALALDCLIERASFRRSVVGGVALGGAFLMAYQTILIILPLLGLVFLRDRFKHFRHLGGALVGLALGIAFQVTLDRWTYGVWGISIRNYLIENVCGVLASLMYKVGLQDTQLARDLYEANLALLGGQLGGDAELSAKGESLIWYLTGLPRMLVWPVLVVAVLGLFRCWLQASWRSSILALLFLVNAGVMSLKGASSFRLWLPLLPMLAPLVAWGWCALRGDGEEKPGRWRRVAGTLVLFGGLWLGLDALEQINTRKFGAYWEAASFANEAVGEEREAALAAGEEWTRPRLSSVYHWAVFGRCNADVDLVKLGHHVDEWQYLAEEMRTALLDELATCRWLLLHKPVLDIDERIASTVNEHFEVVASFWNEDGAPGLGDVRVLRSLDAAVPTARAWEGVRPRRLWELLEVDDPEAYRLEHELERDVPRALAFLEREENGELGKLWFLGFEYEALPGTGFGWITYHWWTDTGFDRDFWLVDRVLIVGDDHAWHNNHVPAHGQLPATEWKAGTLLREGYVLVPGSDPMGEDFRPLGGPWRRGDVLPATLWLKTIRFDERGNDSVALEPAARGAEEPLSLRFQLPPSPLLVSPEGYLCSRDRMILVGAFPLPVIPRYRLPDDGKPVPE